ncbi:MAG: chloride channel protein [Kofleriaceae bacterium]|nr:chloride channel protein [Myxococcales bacterium]MCB9559598.1 chloride channel protein [Kofleriaceae bacterium]MCB9574317.1 chloride channel protein [Kofleriaceae bacterium]
MAEDPPPANGTRAAAATRFLVYVAAICVVAVGAALFATAFRRATELVFRHAYGAPSVVAAIATLPLILRVIVPAIGGFVAGGLASRAKGGHGVGDVMEAVVVGRGFLSMIATLWKAAGTYAALIAGGSVGREGPLIQFGASLAGVATRWLDLGQERGRALILAGTAAGFAAAYNTPFAAILFCVEVVAGLVALDALLPAFVATPIATLVTRAAVGGGPIYGERTFAIVSNSELIAYLGLGLAAGFIGVGFMWLLRAAERGFERLDRRRPVRAAMGGVVVGLLALQLPEVSGNGYEAINLMLGGGASLAMLLLLMPAKAAATAASVGSGAPGGVFTPTLTLGACLGGALGVALAAIAPAHVGPVGAYMLVGMAATCAATTHAPMTAAVMVFELTDDYAIVLPLLLATGAATTVARWLRPDSIYDSELRRRGFGWEVTLEGRAFHQVPDAEPHG